MASSDTLRDYDERIRNAIFELRGAIQQSTVDDTIHAIELYTADLISLARSALEENARLERQLGQRRRK